MAKKKKIDSTPRRKRMKREQRIEHARATKFIESRPEVKHMVRSYARWFGCDLLSAVTELRILGFAISKEYETNLRKILADKIEQKRKMKLAKEEEYSDYMDDQFAHIIGYTSGGVPYGVRWEDMTDFED